MPRAEQAEQGGHGGQQAHRTAGAREAHGAFGEGERESTMVYNIQCVARKKYTDTLVNEIIHTVT